MEVEGGVPVFYPTWDQFRDFKKCVEHIEPIGMCTGIAKVVPPQEWLDKLPSLDDATIQQQVRIKNPIEQEASGVHGIFAVKSILKNRTHSLKSWRKFCDSCPAPLSRNFRGLPKTAASDNLWEYDDSQFTAARCVDLEKTFWRTLGYNAPTYGADVQGSLFGDLQEWNVASLDSLLNRLHAKIPGVNSSYIYCGSWKALFSWHLEDMDLHSINYIHFGAPKQWYAIPQADCDRFYKFMKSQWPMEARRCREFLRHKSYMVSPAILEKNGISVNKIVHRQREFMLTFPYGYHAGYNLGYNLAESVNFATDAWIPIGRKSQPCRCASDNATFDVRVLLGEVEAPITPPQEEDELPRKRSMTGSAVAVPKKKPKLIRTGSCALCPHTWNGQYIMNDANNARVHRICADYIPETYVEGDKVYGLEMITPERFSLRCAECKIASGACFQCEHPLCTRAYHATCAANAGMCTMDGQYLCRFHRPKPPMPPEEAPFTLAWSSSLLVGDQVQCRTEGGGKFFAGEVYENDLSEGMLTVRLYPNFDDYLEVKHKWVYPGALQLIHRPRVQPKNVKRRPKSEPKPKLELTEMLEMNTPEDHAPKRLDLYQTKDGNGEVISPFVFLGVPVPKCLSRTTPL